MDERVGIAVVGASGRMGRMLIQAVEEEPRARLTGVTERPGHDWIGRDLGACLGTGETGVRVSDDALEVFAVSQAVLDFTTPADERDRFAEEGRRLYAGFCANADPTGMLEFVDRHLGGAAAPLRVSRTSRAT